MGRGDLASNPEPKHAVAVTTWRIETKSDSAFYKITLVLDIIFFALIFIPQSRLYRLALCLQWYNGLIIPRVHSSVTERTTV